MMLYCFVMMHSYFMQKNNQIDRSDLIVVNAQSKAAEQIEKEREAEQQAIANQEAMDKLKKAMMAVAVTIAPLVDFRL